MRFMLVVLLWIVLAVASVWASGPGARSDCGDCRCGQATRKVCRLVCETKTEKCTQYDVECEDFCIPGPSKLCGKQCVPHPCNPCEKILRKIWQPTCAKVHTRKVLLKRDVEYEVPAYKWVVEEVCCGCGHCHAKLAELPITAEQAQQPLPLPEAVLSAAEQLVPLP